MSRRLCGEWAGGYVVVVAHVIIVSAPVQRIGFWGFSDFVRTFGSGLGTVGTGDSDLDLGLTIEHTLWTPWTVNILTLVSAQRGTGCSSGKQGHTHAGQEQKLFHCKWINIFKKLDFSFWLCQELYEYYWSSFQSFKTIKKESKIWRSEKSMFYI